MRSRAAGAAGTLAATCAAWWVLTATVATPAGATTQTIETGQSTTEYMLVLSPDVSPAAVNRKLGEAGFNEAEPILGLPSRYLSFRLLRVDSANAKTKGDLLLVDGIRAVRPIYRADGLDYPILSNGQVIVKFVPGTTAGEAAAIAARNGGAIARQIAGLPQAYVLDVVNEAISDAATVATGLLQEPAVVYAHASVLFKLIKHQIDDPLYPNQWHLNNTGQIEGGVLDADIDAPEAWTLTLGQGAVVAVVDDGIQWQHEDLIDNYLTGYDFLDQDNDPTPTYGPNWFYGEQFGDTHGTCTSGLVCARANDIGVRGVAPMASLIGIKIGLGALYTTDQDVADAYLFAEANGAMAVSSSWGGPGGVILPLVPNTVLQLPNVISDAIDQIATAGRGGRGVLLLFSSGNSSTFASFDNRYAGMKHVMAVGATLRNDTLTCYSSYGPSQSVVAPGGGEWVFLDANSYILNTRCLWHSMVTTDVMGVLPGIYPWDLDLDGLPDEGWWIRGYNEPMKFLTLEYYGFPPSIPAFCPLVPVPDPDDPFIYFLECVPLVEDEYTLEYLADTSYMNHFNGTSAACPVAAGVATLVFSIDPTLSAKDVYNIVEHTADKVVTTDGSFDAVTGHNQLLGHGRVNAFRATAATVNGEVWPSPVEEFRNDSTLSNVRIAWELPDWDENGIADSDVISILVVQGPKGQLHWHPTDGIDYLVGEEVTPGVTVVANDLITSVDLAGVPQGSYDYAVFARNFLDYYSWGRRTEVDVNEPLPGTPSLQASVRAEPALGLAPLAVDFYGGAISNSVPPFLSFSWNFGDGGTATGATPTHTYAAPGTYMAVVTVTDAAGATGQASVQVTVSGGGSLPPVARITANPTTGYAPLSVTFDALDPSNPSYDPDGTIIAFAWDFGDGATATGSLVQHVYSYAGLFTTELQAIDNQGNIGTTTVTIRADYPGSGASSALSALSSGASCAAGVPAAVVASAIGLLGLSFIRRRRL